MEGYHGTTPQNSKNILATNELKIRSFSITPDIIIKKNQSLPSDLGQGLYLFLDSEKSSFSGFNNAKLYAQSWRNENHQVAVIKFSFDDGNLLILDLNSQENASRFIKLREQIYQKIETQLGSFKKSSALNRANLDGIFLEYLIQYKYPKVDGVIKDTYTPFYGNTKILSNFPNGRELCLRNTSIINWGETKEVTNGV